MGIRFGYQILLGYQKWVLDLQKTRVGQAYKTKN